MEAKLLYENFKDGLFPVFLFIFAMVAFLKAFYPNHFSEYLRLPFNNKYILIYEKKERKLHLFSVVLFFLQWISLSLFVYVWLAHIQFNKLIISDLLWFDILLITLFLLLLKLLIQRWISLLFELKGFSRSYIFSKISYSNYASILVVIFLFLILYTTELSVVYLFFLLLIFLIINFLGWIVIIKMNQNLMKSHIIYFILYLCTLEIAPYIFLAYGSQFL